MLSVVAVRLFTVNRVISVLNDINSLGQKIQFCSFFVTWGRVLN